MRSVSRGITLLVFVVAVTTILAVTGGHPIVGNPHVSGSGWSSLHITL